MESIIIDRIDREIERLKETISTLCEIRSLFSGHNAAQKVPAVGDIDTMLEFVCKSYACTKEELFGKCRSANLVRARAKIARLLRAKPFNMTYSQIGKVLGGRDHATIINYMRESKRNEKSDSPAQ